MRSLITTTGLFAAAFMLLVTGSARASTIEVKVPFSFVVQGRTLPAGQYRVTTESGLVEFRGEKGNTANLYILTMPASGQDPAGDKPALTFTRHENEYRLSDIWESGTHGLEPVNR